MSGRIPQNKHNLTPAYIYGNPSLDAANVAEPQNATPKKNIRGREGRDYRSQTYIPSPRIQYSKTYTDAAT